MFDQSQSRKALNWTRLDNAAKIFPPTSHGSDTGVFRLSCELNEAVRPDVLQQALDRTLTHYPHMCMVMRRGLFWYYLEQTTLTASVQPEHRPPCAPLYYGSRSLLFLVSYWHHKINLEVYHVLADGAGAITFFQALITCYLSLAHPEAGEIVLPQAAVSQQQADSFQKYYTPHAGRNDSSPAAPAAPHRAYRLRGLRRADSALTVIEGVTDASRVLEAAHQHNTTLTVYLASVLFSAIHADMYVRHARRPVVLTVPVDLRSYFPSATTRNFFGTIRVWYDFSRRDGTFADIVQHTAEAFRTELTPERLARRMNRMAALEHNPLLRPIPLVLKNPVLRLSGNIDSLGETAALSNIGRFRLPDALTPYVRGFGVFMSTSATQLCVCSFGNNLHFGFTSAFEGTEVQRRFFDFLVRDGIPIEIRSSEWHGEVQNHATMPPL